MISEIRKNVWQFKFKAFGSYVYLIKLKEKNILIDTGSPENAPLLLEDLKELKLTPKDIHLVILTHNHWDHLGGLTLFSNSKIYGSEKDFGKNLLDPKKLKIKELKIIETPGHSKGGICILYKDILFSGDTIFHRNTIGRTDLPGSSEKEMQESIKKINKIKFKILCPGHGYN
jgi:glyoxylase-like metal-dependent hydrolase (beta-lactamase superfamily II)